MIRQWIGVGFLIFGMAAAPEVWAQASFGCQLLEERDYLVTDHAVPISADAYLDAQAASSIIREYGVAYKLTGLWPNYVISSELKAFAMQNDLAGIQIYNGEEFAGLVKSSDGKMILVVSESLASDPMKIAQYLRGVTKTEENQGKELRSMIDVSENDDAWSAKVARSVKRAINKMTGEGRDLYLNYEEIKVEKGGLFAEMFGEDKVTVVIRDQGPYEVEVSELEKPFPLGLDGQPQESLMFSLKFKDAAAPWDTVYVSDQAALFTCDGVDVTAAPN